MRLVPRIRNDIANGKGARLPPSARTARPLRSHPDAPQKAVRAAYYRGGTSRGLIFQPIHLPLDRQKWPSVFCQVMGSPDPYGRQLDGMGAGISSLSKICLVERMRKKLRAGKGDAEKVIGIDYTFVGVGIENDTIDVAGNCGNMSSAIAPYAYNAGLLDKSAYLKKDGDVTVRIRNTNTEKYIDSTFTVVKGQAAVLGNYAIDGVSGTGSRIKLDFRDPYGSKTGKVLPTGRNIDTIAGFRVSCVDGANPCIFIRADDIGVHGTILPVDFNKQPDKLAILEQIRKTAAVAMGIAATEDEVPWAIPKIGIVSMSSTHKVLSGDTIKNSQVDLVVRFLSDTQPHRAIPLTAALTTAVAARIPGTVVEQLLAPDPVDESAITIGHASGRIQVNATMDEEKPLIPVLASVYRTARRIFEGNMYWTDEQAKAPKKPDSAPHINPTQRHSLGLAFVEESRGRDSAYLYDGSLDDQEPPIRPVQAKSKYDEPSESDLQPSFVRMEEKHTRSNRVRRYRKPISSVRDGRPTLHQSHSSPDPDLPLFKQRLIRKDDRSSKRERIRQRLNANNTQWELKVPDPPSPSPPALSHRSSPQPPISIQPPTTSDPTPSFPPPLDLPFNISTHITRRRARLPKHLRQRLKDDTTALDRAQCAHELLFDPAQKGAQKVFKMGQVNAAERRLKYTMIKKGDRREALGNRTLMARGDGVDVPEEDVYGAVEGVGVGDTPTQGKGD